MKTIKNFTTGMNRINSYVGGGDFYDYGIDYVEENDRVIYNSKLDMSDDFVRVEYIENTSNAYIDTDVIPNAYTGLHTKFLCSYTSDEYFLGLRNDKNNTRWGIGHSSGGFYWCYGTYQTSNRLGDTKGEFYLNYMDSKKFVSIDLDNSSTLTANLPTLSFTPSFQIRLFGSKGYFNNSVKGRMYYLQITQGTEIIRDFIPVYQISTDTYGFFDLVNNIFYDSENTTKFIGGQVIDISEQ